MLHNEQYGILKEFAELENTPNVPGLDLPGLDIVSLSKGYGARSLTAATREELATPFRERARLPCPSPATSAAYWVSVARTKLIRDHPAESDTAILQGSRYRRTHALDSNALATALSSGLSMPSANSRPTPGGSL